MDSTSTYSSTLTFFDEKRDYEARRNRKSRSHSASSSTSSTSSYASFTDKENRYTFTLPSCYSPPSTFTQTSTTACYSSKPLPPLPSGPHVRFALQKPLPPIPLTLSKHVGSYIANDRPLSDCRRKRSRANSSEDGEAWWAQQRLQTTREWISEKATFGDEDVRSL